MINYRIRKQVPGGARVGLQCSIAEVVLGLCRSVQDHGGCRKSAITDPGSVGPGFWRRFISNCLLIIQEPKPCPGMLLAQPIDLIWGTHHLCFGLPPLTKCGQWLYPVHWQGVMSFLHYLPTKCPPPICPTREYK